METRFTWDPAKAARNRRNHGVSFQMAQEVFADPNHLVTENYNLEGEQRYLAIGMTLKLALVVTVFVDRSDPSEEIIHIISARKAVAYEQSIYEEQLH
jgi:uncharacterized DUF497 family protein